MLKHYRIQYPVGQGGFHGSIIVSNKKVFTYIYDLGTVTKGRAKIIPFHLNNFKNKINFHSKSENNTTIDICFLSHLDSDHVNGLKYLKICGFKVNQFVLPAMNDYERIIAQLSTSNHPYDKKMKSFFNNPAKWLKNEFPECEVNYAEGFNNDDMIENNSEISNQENTFSNQDELDFKWTNKVNTLIKKNCVGLLGNRYGLIVLTPFYHHQSKKDEFLMEILCQKYFKGCRVESLVQQLVDEKMYNKTRTKLSKIYKKYFKDLNLHSLCLGVSYFSSRKCKYYRWPFDYYTTYNKLFHFNTKICSWITTGDSSLTDSILVDKFKIIYKQHLLTAVTFILPHHGSRHNYDISMILTKNIPYNLCLHGIKNKHNHPTLNRQFYYKTNYKHYISFNEKCDPFIEHVVLY